MGTVTKFVRQRYSKLGNTCEQLFHAWRSFTFDENTETIDSYVIRIRQVANCLGYGELQLLEVFKNTLPTKLFWILFPIEDLRQAVDTAKRILTKEKLDKQLTGQTSTSPFMSIREGTDKRVSFNTKDKLGDKIDRLTVCKCRFLILFLYMNQRVFSLTGLFFVKRNKLLTGYSWLHQVLKKMSFKQFYIHLKCIRKCLSKYFY